MCDVVDRVRFAANGVRLGVTRWRADRQEHPPVVLLPGTGQTSAHWASVSGLLSVNRDVYAVTSVATGVAIAQEPTRSP